MKKQSKQWVEADGSASKKAKTVLSSGKVMATVFWYSQGVVLIDYLEKGKTITGQYYATLLDQLKDTIKAKRPHLAKKRVHLVLLPHTPYSPDLAPSDFFLFPNMKKWLDERRFASNAEVIAEANAYFEGLEKSYYAEGLKK